MICLCCIVLFLLALPWQTATAENNLPSDIPSDMHGLVVYYSNRYSVSESKMNRIIKCESGWNTNAHNPNGEDSWGLVQINRAAHPYVSVKMATTPKYAIRFLTYHQSKKDVNWSCK